MDAYKNRLHASQRFSADKTITRGVPLKSMFNADYVKLLAASLKESIPDFDSRSFQKFANRGLESLELKQRAAHVAGAMLLQLPSDFELVSQYLIDSLGPELVATEGNGLATFFYLPHSHLIEQHPHRTFDAGMRANYELTKRFTAEFSIRPYIADHPEKTVAMLMDWSSDPNPHVRRLVSEGTRSRLPWGMRLKAVRDNPQLTLPLLQRLKDDSSQYVRRSVANHLGDIIKDHKELGYQVCDEWTQEVRTKEFDQTMADNRLWIVRHALRLPAKKGDRVAVELRRNAS